MSHRGIVILVLARCNDPAYRAGYRDHRSRTIREMFYDACDNKSRARKAASVIIFRWTSEILITLSRELRSLTRDCDLRVAKTASQRLAIAIIRRSG